MCQVRGGGPGLGVHDAEEGAADTCAEAGNRGVKITGFVNSSVQHLATLSSTWQL